MTVFRSIALALLLVSTINSPLLAHQTDGRSLGMIVTSPEHGDYDSAMQIAIDAGVTRVPLTYFWSALEPVKGTYDDRNLAIAALYFPAMGIPIDIAITPVTSSQVVLPDDLAGKAFDDPVVVTRYLELLDHVLSVLADTQVETLLVGVEVDTLLGHDPAAWASYASLAAAAADFVHSRYPGIEVGVQSTTYSRMTDPDDWEAVDEVCDFIATSYYPLDGLMVRDPSVVADDFDALTAQYPGETIRIMEAGFPSSRTNGSSPELQAQFIHELFAAWDDHADQILSISLATEHEYAPFWVDQFQRFYDNGSRRYASFIGSIGLRSWEKDGRPKPAWEALLQETESRGWRP